MYLFGRLAPGVSLAQARDALNAPYRRILEEVEAPLLTGVSDQTRAQFIAKQIVATDGSRGQMARMTVVGAGVGLLAAFGVGAAAQSLLYGLGGFDPLVVASSVGLLEIIALAAALAPAMRAARIDPMRALRWD